MAPGMVPFFFDKNYSQNGTAPDHIFIGPSEVAPITLCIAVAGILNNYEGNLTRQTLEK